MDLGWRGQADMQLVRDDIDFSAYMRETDPAHKVKNAADFEEGVIDYYHNGGALNGAQLPWPKAGNLIRFRPGEMTLWSGFGGHGKSLVLGQFALAMAARDIRTGIASLEMKPVITLARMCRQAVMNERPSLEAIRRFHAKTDGRLWLYDHQGSVNRSVVLAVIRYCADKLKCQHFILDSLMKCGIGEDDYTDQKNFVDDLTVVARDLGIHVHLVAHSKKGKDELSPPGKMDIKGSGSMADQVDNVIAVWKNKQKELDIENGKGGVLEQPDCLLLVEKQRNGEWEGRIKLWFDKGSQQFMETGIGRPTDILGLLDA